MSTTLLPQFRDQNSNRRFPFCDSASLKDTDGHLLPVDFIVDAAVYPIDITGGVFMSSIIPAESTVFFAEATTGTVFAQAVYSADALVSDVVETGPYARQIGVVVFGPGIAEAARGRGKRTFTPAATMLCPSASVPLQQKGVRGILLPDGQLMTGDIRIEGRDGVFVTTRQDEETGQHILRFDVLGVPPRSGNDACVDLGPPICTIAVRRLAGSAFLIGRLNNTEPYTLTLMLKGVSLADLCEAGHAQLRPNTLDPCAPAVVDPEPADAGAQSIDFAVCATGAGNFMIAAPSTDEYPNPISVRPLPRAAQPPLRMTVPRRAGVEEGEEAAARFRQPVAPGGGVLIEVQGIGNG